MLITFQVCSLPEAFSGTPQEFADLLVSRMSATFSGTGMIGQIGGVLPTTDVGLFVDTDRKVVMIWDDSQAKYVDASAEKAGTIKLWPGGAAPSGYLLCDGSSYIKTDYPALAAILVTNYNLPDTTWDRFLTPDFRGRCPVGAGAGVIRSQEPTR